MDSQWLFAAYTDWHHVLLLFNNLYYYPYDIVESIMRAYRCHAVCTSPALSAPAAHLNVSLVLGDIVRPGIVADHQARENQQRRKQ